MSNKSKRSKQKRRPVTTSSSRTDKLMDLMGHQIFQGDYAEAIANGERLLSYLPQHSSERADVFAQLGVAHGMLQNYPQSYEAFTEAVKLAPNNAQFWYNRGMASRYTTRIGRSLRDLERAGELQTTNELPDLDKALKVSRKLVKDSLKMRGPNFTLDQLIEQEDLFQRGLKLMEACKWEEAG